MRYKVVYFTRTNTSKRVAEIISERLTCDLVKITDHRNWNGKFGFFKAGYYSSTDKKVEIEILGDLENVDEYIVVTPLWAGGIASATKAFLNTIPREKVHLVVTSLGSHVKDRTGYKSISDITRQEGNETKVIDELVNRLANEAKDM